MVASATSPIALVGWVPSVLVVWDDPDGRHVVAGFAHECDAHEFAAPQAEITGGPGAYEVVRPDGTLLHAYPARSS